MAGVSQTRINPFEIKPRLKSMNIIDTFTPVSDTIISDSSNIFLIDSDSLSKKNTAAKGGDIVNPFDVDHVPVRQSAISKRTEKLQNQTESSKSSNSFLFWFLLFSCAILAIVINIKSKILSLISRSIFNENMLKLLHREESTNFSPYWVLLYFIYWINLAVFIYLSSIYFGGPRGILVFIYILLGTIFVYIIRHISLKFLGGIFDLSKSTELFGFSLMIFNQFGGLMMIPMNLLFAFGPSGVKEFFLWGTILMLGILLFLRTIRGIFIVSEYLTDRFFQIFIYLCAFEIAPMLILVKTIINFSK